MKPIKTYLIIKYHKRREFNQRKNFYRGVRAAGWTVGAIFGLLVACLVAGTVLAYYRITSNLPSPSTLSALLDSPGGLLLQPTRIYDRTGQHLLLTLDNGIEAERQVISLNSSTGEHLPEDLVNATLVTTDPNFWSHPGFLLTDLTSSKNSTLAEILVSDLLLSNEPASLTRNLRVRILAAQVTALYGREKILEYYLNNAYYGHQTYGSEEAAQLYFGKSVSQLNLAESALLAAVANAPALDPLDAPDDARSNQQVVIAEMVKAGYITQGQADAALATPLVFKAVPAESDNPAKAFTALVEKEAADKVGWSRLERGGLVIDTTLDYDLQLQLSCTVRTQLLRVSTNTSDASLSNSDSSGDTDCEAARLLPTLSFDSNQGTTGLSTSLAASGMIVDPQTGQILAMLGDTTITGGESTTLQGHASGSLLTPFIYLAGFTRGMGPASLVWDVPSSLPSALSNQVNPDGQFHGPVRIRTAMVNDYLAPAAQLLYQIGSNVVWSSFSAFGLPDLSQDSVPFSGGTLTPLQAAQAYVVLANEGVMAGQSSQNTGSGAPLQLSGVLEIQDSHSNTLEDWGQPETRSILSSSLAYLVNNVLSDETARWASMGSSNPLAIGRQAAAKLGLTSDELDTWTIGYTPQRLGVIWMGNTTTKLDSQFSAGVWHAMMQYASRDLSTAEWEIPAEISTVNVCDPSGLLPTTACPNVVSEVFLSGNEPSSPDNLYQTFEIDRETGRLATVFTSPGLVEDETYLVVPSEARPWAEAAGLAVPPDLYDVIQEQTILENANITSPALYTYLKGTVQIRGTAAGDTFASYQVQVGKGLNPNEWIQVGETSQKEVKDGVLASWDTSQAENGLYAVRLIVVQTDQEIQTAIILVTVDNTPPTASITSPVDGQSFNYVPGAILPLQVEASDATALDRVEWWIDGNLVGSMTTSPFTLNWDEQIGSHTLLVKAYDKAENMVTTGPINFSIVEK